MTENKFNRLNVPQFAQGPVRTLFLEARYHSQSQKLVNSVSYNDIYYLTQAFREALGRNVEVGKA